MNHKKFKEVTTSLSNIDDNKLTEQVSPPLTPPSLQKGKKGHASLFQQAAMRLTTPLETGQQKGSIPVLDGVRAIACLIVIGYHINLITRSTHIWEPDQYQFISAFLLAGGSGVTLFFVLSGFLLFIPYAKMLLLKNVWPSTWRFYLRRALRIIPAYYICLFTLILLSHQEYLRLDHWTQLLLFLTFFMDSTPATYQAINGPFWTLAVEWQFYLFLPLIVLGIRAIVWRCRPGRRLATTAMCLLAIIVWGMISQPWAYALQSHPWPNILALSVIRVMFFGWAGKYLQDFAVGMLISLLYVYASSLDKREIAKKVLSYFNPWLWVMGIALLIFMVIWHNSAAYGNEASLLGGLKNAYDACGEVGFAIGFGLCILALLFGQANVQKYFAWTPLRWIGHVSYSAYMWHLPMLLFFMVQIGEKLTGWNTLLVFTFYWLWVLLIILPWSYVSFALTERPGMWLSQNLSRKR